MGCSSSNARSLQEYSRRPSADDDRRQTLMNSEDRVEPEVIEEGRSAREKSDSVDSNLFVSEEEALFYVQQELGVDAEQAEAVLETIQRSTRGVSSLDLVIINAKIKEVEKSDSVDSNLFVSEEEALFYVQQELGVDAEQAEAVLETIQRSTRGVSSLDLVIINAKIKEVKGTLEPKFAEYDPNSTGYVSPEDAIAIMRDEFPGLPYATIQSMVQRYDKDMNNKVDFGEFILFYSCVKAKKDQLEERFDELDKDHSGDLQTEELCEILMTKCGLRETQARMLIEDFDVDRSGSIDRTEFNLLWTKVFE